MREKHRKKTGGQQAILRGGLEAGFTTKARRREESPSFSLGLGCSVFISATNREILAYLARKSLPQRHGGHGGGSAVLLVFPCRGEIIGRTILPSIQNDRMLTGGTTWRGERFNALLAEPRAS
jgi:hypothetical protein